MSKVKRYTYAEWVSEAKRRFGDNSKDWKFVCPSCGHVASIQDWEFAGAPEGAIAFSCIGRYLGSQKSMFDKSGGPCNYTTGGLFNISPVIVQSDGQEHSVFDFAEASA